MKALARRDCLLQWPQHNVPFEIDTDSSDYQLGGVIKQNGFPLLTTLGNSVLLNKTTPLLKKKPLVLSKP